MSELIPPQLCRKPYSLYKVSKLISSSSQDTSYSKGHLCPCTASLHLNTSVEQLEIIQNRGARLNTGCWGSSTIQPLPPSGGRLTTAGSILLILMHGGFKKLQTPPTLRSYTNMYCIGTTRQSYVNFEKL